MKTAALILLFASTAALEAGDTGSAVPQTDVRRETLSFYKYEHTRPPSPLPPFLAREAPPPPGQYLVNAAPSDLREPHVLDHLHAVILQERADARAAMVASRLGIGVSSVRVGRYFSAGAATAFYIPAEIGLSVAW
ncbi:MAG TPA: hypothetical protein VN775_05520 [Opitutaceae bacterium]|nr:hypothetical protein [Opitutaceae bacterium]